MIARKALALTFLALLGTAVWLVAWMVGLIDDGGHSPGRYRLLGLGFGVTIAIAACGAWHAVYEQIVARRYFTALCQVDPNKLSADTAGADLPCLPSSNPWHAVASAYRDMLAAQAERTLRVEQARAAAEIRLRRSVAQQQQIEAILAGLPEPVLAVGPYDDLVLANNSAERLFHLDLQKTEERALAKLVQCEELLSVITETRTRKLLTQRSTEVQLADEQGQPRFYSVTARNLPELSADSTAACGAVAVLRDISGLKAMQKRNAEFVSAVSHEMKAPLAGIKAYLELLLDGEAEDEKTREEFLEVINSQAERLQRLIDNLLNLARMEAGVVNVSKQMHSLNDLLEESLHVVRPAAEAKNIELANYLSNLHLSVLVDRDMVMQAAINLLSNAIKYTPADGKVTLRSRLLDGQVSFEVQDTGVGLSEEDQSRVFEKFYRVKKDANMAPGTGLGLPLAKHIVEDVHAGTLCVLSRLGAGSTFTVTLPHVNQNSPTINDDDAPRKVKVAS